MRTPVLASFLKTPSDGFTKDEKQIARLLTEETVRSLYMKLPNSRMKAITALHFELGYPQQLVADIFGVSQPQIALDIANIKRIIKGGTYQKHRKLVKVKIGEKEFGLWDKPMDIKVDQLLAFLYTFTQN